jgi:hypothetical protein
MRFPLTAQGSRFATGVDNYVLHLQARTPIAAATAFERREETSGSACRNPSALHPAFNRAVAAFDELGRSVTTPLVLAGLVVLCSNRAAILVPSGLPRPAQRRAMLVLPLMENIGGHHSGLSFPSA